MQASIQINFAGIGPVGLSNLVTITGSGAKQIEESISGNATNTQVAFALTIANAKAFYMVSSGALTIKTNSSSSPQETITLVANRPVLWISGFAGFASPFSDNVTTIYCTNAASTAATLKIQVLEDVTP